MRIYKRLHFHFTILNINITNSSKLFNSYCMVLFGTIRSHLYDLKFQSLQENKTHHKWKYQTTMDPISGLEGLQIEFFPKSYREAFIYLLKWFSIKVLGLFLLLSIQLLRFEELLFILSLVLPLIFILWLQELVFFRDICYGYHYCVY